MLRAEWLNEPGREFPFVGRDEQLEILRNEVRKGSPSRWLITGEKGIGKTRLVEELGLSFNERCRFFRLRGAGGPGEEPFWLAPEIEKGDASEPLLIFDDIDGNYPVDLGKAGLILERVAEGPVFCTAQSEEVWDEWRYFTSFTHRMRLTGLGDEDVDRLLAAAEIAVPPRDIVDPHRRDGLENPGVLMGYIDALRFVQAGDEMKTILAPDGRPLQEAGSLRRVELSVREVNDALIAELAARPELLRELSPRKFEQLVAELYSRSGFEVELTQATRDGGVDIYAYQRAPFGSFLTVIDCKRYREDRPIGVGLVRSLYGAVVDTKASTGVIATTSYFTKGAKDFQQQREHRIGLQDFASLKRMLSSRAG